MTISSSSLKPFLLSLCIASLLTACSNSKTDSNSGSSSNAPTASSSSSGEAFEGLITSRMTTGSQAMEIKYAIKGSRSRIETQLAAGGTQMGVVLMDFASGSQTMLMPQMKTYMTTNWDDEGGVKNMVEKMASEAEKTGSGNYFNATATGKTETVAGHTCTHWILGDKQDTDACLAKGLGYFGGGGQSDGIFGKLKNIALGDKTKAQLQANPEFLKFAEGGVFPLKLAVIENGQPRTIMEVTKVERKTLDDALFAIPADFKKMEIPGMPMGKR
ncbi:MAG: DUF4412 domain-containing protein [Blastocatellia bacterium]